MGHEEPEVRVVYLYAAEPVVRLLHQRRDTLLLRGTVGRPQGAAELVGCQPKGGQGKPARCGGEVADSLEAGACWCGGMAICKLKREGLVSVI